MALSTPCGTGSNANPRLTPHVRPAYASRKVILPGPNPTDRARPGSKHHIVTDANGTPLAAILTGANVNDVTQLLPLIDAIPSIRGLRGHPIQRPRVVYADCGYDSERHRRALRNRGIQPVIAKRRTGHGSGLGKYRWVGSNALTPGSTVFVAYALASSDRLTFTKHS